MTDNSATYMGRPPDQGVLIPLAPHPDEGYAILSCGGTTVLLSYTLLHHLRFATEGTLDSLVPVLKAQDALNSITCEASLGRKGGSVRSPLQP